MGNNEPKHFLKNSSFSAIFDPSENYPDKKRYMEKAVWLQPCKI